MTGRRCDRKKKKQQQQPQQQAADAAAAAAAVPSTTLHHHPRSHSQPAADQHYDVCIVGAGPAGLACLSAIREQFSLDSLSDGQVTRAMHSLPLHRPRRVCVIDPAPYWLETWRRHFTVLGIDYLRSPALAHPNAFDQNALLAYAMATGRMDELIESGCVDLKHLLPLGQSQIGLWKLPSTQLFMDFCLETLRPLPHDYLRGHVIDVRKSDDDPSRPFQVIVSSNHNSHNDDDDPQSTQAITADAVILAMGVAGAPPTVPRSLRHCPPRRIVQWNQLDQLPIGGGATKPTTGHNNKNSETTTTATNSQKPQQPLHYLVVGGGLTAVQVALKLLKDDTSCRVTLCSRRPLMERHFDIPVEWFDRRTATKCLYDFYHDPVQDRLRALRATKDGGSVPPIYMRQLRRMEKAGRLDRLVAEPVYLQEESAATSAHDDGNSTKSSFRMLVTKTNNGDGRDGTAQQQQEEESLSASSSKVYHFDAVVVACGTKPDCLQNPLLRRLHQRWPVDVVDGYPTVSEDLQWTDRLFTVGGLGALHVGPDAANLMGIRRAALTIAHSLQCRGWLREKALTNPFAALFADDTSSSSSEDDEVEDAVSTSGSDEHSRSS
jgi:Pyridine nucleotide-disulphide oxidoreductase